MIEPKHCLGGAINGVGGITYWYHNVVVPLKSVEYIGTFSYSCAATVMYVTIPNQIRRTNKSVL